MANNRALVNSDNRFTVWSRMKQKNNKWTLDRAINELVQETNGRIGYIYQISFAKTPLKYVGQTKVSIEERKRGHLYDAFKKGSQAEVHKFIRKYGPESFQIKAIEEDLNQEELDDKEKYWIKEMNTLTPNGLDMRDGGSGGGNKGKRIQGYPSYIAYAAAVSEQKGKAEHVILRALKLNKPIPENPRKMSKHPEAGTNLWRRWKGLLKRLDESESLAELSPDWEDYDIFASAVRPGYSEELDLIRIDKSKPWGPGNFNWATTQEKVEQTHGIPCNIDGKDYSSRNAVVRAFGIGRSTLSNRIDVQDMSIEEAVKKPLGPTSKRRGHLS